MTEVFSRPSLARKLNGIVGLDREAVIRVIEAATYVEPEHTPAVSRDPKDDKFLAAAMAATADYLVSEDNDLLVLGAYEGIRIVDAATFLTILETESGPD